MAKANNEANEFPVPSSWNKNDAKEKSNSKFNIKKLHTLLQKKNATSNAKKKCVHSSQSEVKPIHPLCTNGSPVIRSAKNQLESSHFRYLNEQLYSIKSSEAWKLFQEDQQSFFIYHRGFENQMAKWPMNPLDLIIEKLRKKSQSLVIADFGCGTARLAQALPNEVHSFDLVAVNEKVTACDMAHVPLQAASVDIAVFCLSLMGTNVNDFLLEANRVLKLGGGLQIAEVESRCPNLESFLKAIEKFGFRMEKHIKKGYFFIAIFIKKRHIPKNVKLPTVLLKPCLYKKR